MSLPDPRCLLSELVSIESPSGDEGAAADWVGARCEEWGLVYERIGHSVIVRVSHGAGPRLLMNSHLDTVPVGVGWDGNPFDGTWRNGKLVARGANDAKAAAVSMLLAALVHARSNKAPAGELLVALNASEETNNSGMVDVLAHLGFPDERIDGAVTGEPTNLEVVRAQSGLGVLEAHWTGRACHAAHVARVENDSALFRAAREVAQLPDWFELDGVHALLGPSTLVCTMLRAGTRHNVVPDSAQAVFDARLAPPHDAQECLALLAERLPSATVTVRSERLRPHETAADHPLVKAALAAAGQSEAVGSSTMSDMALLQGVPAVKCGPGVTARSHTANEWVTEDELIGGCTFYRSLVPAALAALSAKGATA